ncbi:MAG: hypothetical protein JWO94_185, partial [Verrucomicrobiaceae bacterium]|nr:hypothetical protein [Verrucomicrobiaceae bacterium]
FSGGDGGLLGRCPNKYITMAAATPIAMNVSTT